MAKQISYKIIPLCLGVLAVSLLLGYVVLAWTEPTAGPPEGNVPPPLNTGINYQVKDGDLGLKTFYTDDINIGGTIPDLYSAHGNLIVKDSSNNITLEIDGGTGNVTMSGNLDVSGDISANNYPPSETDPLSVHKSGDTMSGNLDIDAGLTVGNPTDGNKGAGTINAEKIYVQGSEISDGIEGGNVYWFDKVGILLKYGAVISCGTNWYGSSWIDVKCSGYTKAENGILYTKVVAEGSRSCNDYYLSCNSGWQEGLTASCSNSNAMGPQTISASADTNRNQISVSSSYSAESITKSASCSSVEWK